MDNKQQSLKNFQILQKLGEGSYSQVFKALRITDNQIYAIKKVRMAALKDKERENALNEVRILASVNDPYIVGYKEAFIDEESQVLCVVMEYASDGDLQNLIQSTIKRNAQIPEHQIWTAIYQMSKGLKKLHDMKIVHRDLKCANVFIHNGVFKLGDLNVSKVAKRGLVYTQTGTPYYASPEVWRDEPYDMRSDIWSLGCVIYEMAALKPPFRASDMQGLYKKVQKGQCDPIPKKYSKDLQTLLLGMIQVQQRFININQQVLPSKRLTCGQIINNPLILKHIDLPIEKQSNSKNELLQTIQLPKQLKALKDILPKSKYENSLNNSLSQERKQEKKVEKTFLHRVQSAIPFQRVINNANNVNSNPIKSITTVNSQIKPVPKSALPSLAVLPSLAPLPSSLPQIPNKPALFDIYAQYPSAPRYSIPTNKRVSIEQISTSSPIKSEAQSKSKTQNTPDVKAGVGKLIIVPSAALISSPLNTHKLMTSQRSSTPHNVELKNSKIGIVNLKSDQNRPQEDEETFNGLVVEGLHKINPMSIQSILCQPILTMNDSPFPSQAKVLAKKKQPQYHIKIINSVPKKIQLSDQQSQRRQQSANLLGRTEITKF